VKEKKGRKKRMLKKKDNMSDVENKKETGTIHRIFVIKKRFND